MDKNHNPEFTSMECYMAYGNMESVMDVTEQVVSKAAVAATGSMVINYQGKSFDLTPPWKKISMSEAIREITGVDFDQINTDEEARKAAIGMGMVMPMEAGYFQGFSADVSGFKSAAVIAPMMSSALLVYVFELEEGANVRDFVSFLNDNADPAWMVCMTAETTTIGAIDNYALVAYAPTNMPGVVGEAEVVAPEFTEGSEVETLWNDFLAYMDVNASFALATDVADYLAGNEVLGTEAATEALGESFEAEGLKYAVEGYNNAAVIKAGETALYIIQIDLGMDAWADYYVGGNIAEGADAVWGAHGTTFVIMMGIEA